MVKVLKILGKSVLGILEWILILLIVFSFAIRSSWFQTYAARKATNYLTEKLGAPIQIDKIDITFIDRAYFEGVLVYDQKGDTLVYSKRLFVNLDDYNLSSKTFNLQEVSLEDAVVKLKKYKGESVLNFQFLADYFKSNSKQKKSTFSLKVKSTSLCNVNFVFLDANKPIKNFGVDYTNLDLKHVQLNITDLVVSSEDTSGEIAHLSTIEKSGFQLNDFTAQFRFNQTGTFLQKLKIVTPKSNIYAPHFALKTKNYASYKNFLDSVDFDAQLTNSTVSLYDVSLFATALEGMTDTVNLSVDVSRKVKNLHLKNMKLAFGKESFIQGKFSLPDFRDIENSIFSERVAQLDVRLEDLKSMRLPKKSGFDYLSFPAEINRLGYFKGTDIRLDGSYSQFVIRADGIDTRLGSVHISPGLVFNYHEERSGFTFGPTTNSVRDIRVNNFDLGTFLQNKELGLVAGNFDLSGFGTSFKTIDFSLIEGDVERFDFMDYAYTAVAVRDANFKDQKFEGIVTVKDENLELEYAGFLDLKGQKHLKFKVDVRKALLKVLNLVDRDSSNFMAEATVDWFGLNPETFNGSVTLDNVFYKEKKDSIRIPELKIALDRGNLKDKMTITSSVLNAVVEGELNLNTIANNLKYQFSQVVPVLVKAEKTTDEDKKSDFTYDVRVKNLQPFFDIFAKELYVADQTQFVGFYNESNSEFKLDLLSDKIGYKSYYAENISLAQELQFGQLIAIYDVDKIHISDTLECNDFHFTTLGFSNTLDAQMSWNPKTTNPTNISWATEIVNEETFKFDFLRSYFTVKEHRWNINNLSEVIYAPDSIVFNNFKIERAGQYLSLEGLASDKSTDKLNVVINNLDLTDFSGLLDQELEMQGITNLNGSIATPFSGLTFNGSAAIDNLYLNKEEVGDILLAANFDNERKVIVLDGDLNYRNTETFAFEGNYFLEREKDNLDFNLLFDGADLEVVNAFMNPDAVANIKGSLTGKVKVKGTPSSPVLVGKVNLDKGNAKLALLGANFKFGGEIDIDESGVYI
ncbi:MAG: hypothetical protein ACPGU5_07110, partial [Lishizhenia sp.]